MTPPFSYLASADQPSQWFALNLDPSIRAPTRNLDSKSRIEPENLRHPLPASDKSCLDLSPDRHLRAVQLLLGHTKIESTVRYLGIEVDDALAIRRQVDV